jgi:hypothetical protein
LQARNKQSKSAAGSDDTAPITSTAVISGTQLMAWDQLEEILESGSVPVAGVYALINEAKGATVLSVPSQTPNGVQSQSGQTLTLSKQQLANINAQLAKVTVNEREFVKFAVGMERLLESLIDDIRSIPDGETNDDADTSSEDPLADDVYDDDERSQKPSGPSSVPSSSSGTRSREPNLSSLISGGAATDGSTDDDDDVDDLEDSYTGDEMSKDELVFHATIIFQNLLDAYNGNLVGDNYEDRTEAADATVSSKKSKRAPKPKPDGQVEKSKVTLRSTTIPLESVLGWTELREMIEDGDVSEPQVRLAFNECSDSVTHTVNLEQFVQFFQKLDEMLGTTEDSEDGDGNEDFVDSASDHYQEDDVLRQRKFEEELGKEFDEIVAELRVSSSSSKHSSSSPALIGSKTPTLTAKQFKTSDLVASFLASDAVTAKDVNRALAGAGVQDKQPEVIDKAMYIRAMQLLEGIANENVARDHMSDMQSSRASLSENQPMSPRDMKIKQAMVQSKMASEYGGDDSADSTDNADVFTEYDVSDVDRQLSADATDSVTPRSESELREQAEEIFYELLETINLDRSNNVVKRSPAQFSSGHKLAEEQLPTEVIMQWADIQALIHTKELSLEEVERTIGTVCCGRESMNVNEFVKILSILELLIAKNRGLLDGDSITSSTAESSTRDFSGFDDELDRPVRPGAVVGDGNYRAVSAKKGVKDTEWISELFQKIKDQPDGVSVESFLQIPELNTHIMQGTVKRSQIVSIISKFGLSAQTGASTKSDANAILNEKQFIICLERCLDTICANQAAQALIDVKSRVDNENKKQLKSATIVKLDSRPPATSAQRQQGRKANQPDNYESLKYIQTADSNVIDEDELQKLLTQLSAEGDDDDDEGSNDEDGDENTGTDIEETEDDRLIRYSSEFDSLKSAITDKLSVDKFVKSDIASQFMEFGSLTSEDVQQAVRDCRILGKDMDLVQYMRVCESLHKMVSERVQAAAEVDDDTEVEEYKNIDDLPPDVLEVRSDEEIEKECRKTFRELAGQVNG